MDPRNAQLFRVARRVAARTAALVALLLATYAAAGLLGGAVAANRDWRAPAKGVTIFVESNGVHTGIVVPKVAAGIDWRGVAPARDLADPRFGGYDHLSFGWGEATFYLETPTWWDVKPSTVLAAAIGSDRTLVHVDHVPRPRVTDDVRAIVLTPDQYRRLAGFIAATLAPERNPRHGYFAYDAFYAAKGRYSAIRTCNAWVGEALRHAGVRVGIWTPFPATVMWWF